MATRTETVYHHSCDLCGNERDQDELSHLWGPTPRHGQRPEIDICADCQHRPVSELLTWFARQQEPAPRTAATRRRRPQG
jgi:uncharacterized protein YijF (DUF1287 family)